MTQYLGNAITPDTINLLSCSLEEYLPNRTLTTDSLDATTPWPIKIVNWQHYIIFQLEMIEKKGGEELLRQLQALAQNILTKKCLHHARQAAKLSHDYKFQKREIKHSFEELKILLEATLNLHPKTAKASIPELLAVHAGILSPNAEPDGQPPSGLSPTILFRCPYEKIQEFFLGADHFDQLFINIEHMNGRLPLLESQHSLIKLFSSTLVSRLHTLMEFAQPFEQIDTYTSLRFSESLEILEDLYSNASFFQEVLQKALHALSACKYPKGCFDVNLNKQAHQFLQRIECLQKIYLLKDNFSHLNHEISLIKIQCEGELTHKLVEEHLKKLIQQDSLLQEWQSLFNAYKEGINRYYPHFIPLLIQQLKETQNLRNDLKKCISHVESFQLEEDDDLFLVLGSFSIVNIDDLKEVGIFKGCDIQKLSGPQTWQLVKEIFNKYNLSTYATFKEANLLNRKDLTAFFQTKD